MPRQSTTVWAVAFACVISFMGIGLVDPILKPIADSLGATPSQVSLLFTSYMAVTGVAMLGTGWVSSRMGAKWTLILGLAIIVVGAGLAGMQDSVGGIVWARALWGLGNALFISTALATIVSAAAGSVGQAIVLYEAALGIGIAIGPLVGGELGRIGWRFPFFGVAVLMLIALLATLVALPKAPRPQPSRLSEPIRALAHPGLLSVAITALLYNFGFFTLLAFTPFPLNMDARGVGLVFFGWGVMLAITSVWVAPWLQRRWGTVPSIIAALFGFAVVLAVMAAFTADRDVLIGCVVLAGGFLGVNNTLVTEAVMHVSPHPRGVASSAYSFVRFSGGAVAPWLAGRLGEEAGMSTPYWVAAAIVACAAVLMITARGRLAHLPGPMEYSRAEAEILTTADAG
ncbi:MFS transporter [Mobilicoccus massiliensis]|uniref:MFS transporter n=1 Tax=Mobilicoccus massiliensis TaxID=1522310 RepID=UPI00058F2AAF|nr:MFS transporter [Mobilicoccus massiliensis]